MFSPHNFFKLYLESLLFISMGLVHVLCHILRKIILFQHIPILGVTNCIRNQRENCSVLFTVSVSQVEIFQIVVSWFSKSFHVKYEIQFTSVPSQKCMYYRIKIHSICILKLSPFPSGVSLLTFFPKQCSQTHRRAHAPWSRIEF